MLAYMASTTNPKTQPVAKLDDSGASLAAPKQAPSLPVEAPVVKPPEPPAKIRFDHPDAYGVFVLLPADTFYAQRCIDEFEDDLAYLETPPAFVRELDPDLVFPGALLYVAHPKTARVRDPETKRFVQAMSIHLSEPLDIKQFFGALDPRKRMTQQNLRHAGLNRVQLHEALQAACDNDPRGYFWLVRETPDGKFKLFDN